MSSSSSSPSALERNPCEEVWRGLKQDIAANRAYPTVDDLAERAVTWLDGLNADERLRRCGLRSSKFDWLFT